MVSFFYFVAALFTFSAVGASSLYLLLTSTKKKIPTSPQPYPPKFSVEVSNAPKKTRRRNSKN